MLYQSWKYSREDSTLLSKTSLKKAGTVLSLQNDSIKMFNEDMEVTTSNNGHHAINIYLT